jgi:hypothetical protein
MAWPWCLDKDGGEVEEIDYADHELIEVDRKFCMPAFMRGVVGSVT